LRTRRSRQLVAVIEVALRQPASRRTYVGYAEVRVDLRARRAGADRLGIRAVAEAQAEGIEDD
jgi:hypothetical protein